MAFSVGNGLVTGFISNERISAIKNAQDEQAASAMSLWEKIKQFFFNTHQQEAQRLLYRLIHNTPQETSETVSLFYKLHNMAKVEHQHKFEMNFSHNVVNMKIDDFTLSSQYCDPHGKLAKLNNTVYKEYFTMQHDEDPRDIFTCDLPRGKYTFRNESGEQHKYNMKGKKADEMLLNKIFDFIYKISGNNENMFNDVLKVNSQKSLLTINTFMIEDDLRFPLFQEQDKTIIQEFSTHRQSDGDVIIQNRRSFYSSRNKDKIQLHKEINQNTPPYPGKIDLHSVWRVTREGIEIIGLSLEK